MSKAKGVNARERGKLHCFLGDCVYVCARMVERRSSSGQTYLVILFKYVMVQTTKMYVVVLRLLQSGNQKRTE